MATNPQPIPPNGHKFDRFIGIIGVGLALLIPLLQANGVDVNWQVSTLAYFAIIALIGWSLVRHAIPHWSNRLRYFITAVAVLSISGLAFYAVRKQYRREHPVLVADNQSKASPSAPAVPVTVQIAAKAARVSIQTRTTREERSVPASTNAENEKLPPPQSPEVISAPNGIAVGGNARVGSATVNNGPPPLKLTWSQESKPSQDANHPYYKELHVTPNVEWHPVSIAVFCSGEIKVIAPYGVLLGADAFVTDQSNKIGYVFVQDPAVAPSETFVVGIFSDKPIDVLSVEISPKSARRNLFMNPQ